MVTGFPKLLAGPLTESMLKRAQDKGLVEIAVHDLRDYTTDRHRTIDDAPYGGGAGMVLKPEPLAACIEALQRRKARRRGDLSEPRTANSSSQRMATGCRCVTGSS